MTATDFELALAATDAGNGSTFAFAGHGERPEDAEGLPHNRRDAR